MKQVLYLFFLTFVTIVNSQNNNPFIPKEGKLVADFVPNKWKVIAKSEGDLNKDKINDVAFVIENTATENIVLNGGFGKDTLNLNPRFLLVLFKTDSKYVLKSINKKFIPSQDNSVSPCLDDPFMENGGIEIKNGVLNIDFHYWLSCGSWFVTDRNYKFRFQGESFVLIGYDSSSFHRSTGEGNSLIINFLSKKKELITGTNEFKETNPKTTWKNIKIEKLIKLEDLTTDSEIDY
ncbi:hypothetical protein [Flavobacterium sp.]|uniref:hypothetical protein n=1 Tax=Flavobacterium sp. TaxID=239 RepID=UPI0026130E12|nr:hypothetical protein [Flavobacterium sp.]